MSGTNLTGQCNWHRISTTGETTQTGQTMWAAPWSWILRSNRIYIQDPLSSSSDIFVYVTIMSVTPVRCIGSGVWTYLFFCSPIVPPSFWGGQVVKGCKSGVASKYAKTRTTVVHPSLKFPWNSLWLRRLVDEVSTKQKLILLWALQQLVPPPHHTRVSKLGSSTSKKCRFNPFPVPKALF